MLDIGNLTACIEDVRRATLDRDAGPTDPTDYYNLRGRLESSRNKLPPLDRETDKDLQQIRLAGRNVSAAEAKQSAKIVAQTLVRGKVEALEKHALGDLQDWHDEDEQIADQLRLGLATLHSLEPIPKEFYAAHAVAAAVMAAVATDGDIPLIFERAIAILKQMHDRNPSWGPLYVAHPGDILRCVAYQFT